MTTIKRLIRDTQATVITMQETKCQKAGQINFDGYFTYEHTRNSKEGGGVAVSALKMLRPVFLSDGGEGIEAVPIKIHVKNMAISVTSAYGPQESAHVENKIAFWKYLSTEAQRSKAQGDGFVLQGDLNSWLGPNLIKGDCHAQNRNGKLFASFLEENRLTCVNSLPLTVGVVTRSRVYMGIEKKSTIDFYVVCERVLPYVESMKIDNGREHTLTNYKKGSKAVDSDHRPLVMNIKLEVPPNKISKVEILDFKDVGSQRKFSEITSESQVFTECFENVLPLSQQANNWLRTVKVHCKKAFKTIIIRSRKIKPSTADQYIGQRNKLMKLGDTQKVLSLDAKIAKIISEDKRNKAFMFKRYMNKDDTQPVSEMWKLKQALFPKKSTHTSFS